MNRFLLAASALAATIAIAGCATPQIEANVSTFHEISPNDHSDKRIAVVPWREEMKNSLEFKNYAALLESRLREKGFTVVSLFEGPELIGFLDFGIDSGREVISTYSVPHWGVTGYSSAYTTGTVTSYGGMGTYSGTTTLAPQYGVTGYSTGASSDTVYARFVNFDIVRIVSEKEHKKVFEGKLRSSGTCGSLPTILPPLLDALFRDFPKQGGRRVTLPWSGKC